MLNIKKQILRLYLSSMLGDLSLTGAWVAKAPFTESVWHWNFYRKANI